LSARPDPALSGVQVPVQHLLEVCLFCPRFCGFVGKGDMYLPEISRGVIAGHWGYIHPEYKCQVGDRLQRGHCSSRQLWPVPPHMPCHVPGKDVLPASTYIDEHEREYQPDLIQMNPLLPPDKVLLPEPLCCLCLLPSSFSFGNAFKVQRNVVQAR
jgi:hypothetical protein